MLTLYRTTFGCSRCGEVVDAELFLFSHSVSLYASAFYCPSPAVRIDWAADDAPLFMHSGCGGVLVAAEWRSQSYGAVVRAG